jgi:hypothetical protein
VNIGSTDGSYEGGKEPYDSTNGGNYLTEYLSVSRRTPLIKIFLFFFPFKD